MNTKNGLSSVFAKVDACARCRKQRNPLRHILGGGETRNPRFAFVFINPTHRNRSSAPDYHGIRRYPFIGVRHFYRFLSDAGFLEKQTIEPLYTRGWRQEDEQSIEQDHREHCVYMTNMVKCAQPHPRYPSADAIAAQLPLLSQELSIVQPRYVVAFGGPSIQTLIGQSLLLRDVLAEVRSQQLVARESLGLHDVRLPVLPCFFPLGHGNPPKALEVLRYIRSRFR